MNTYQTRTPRIAAAFAAIGLTVATLAVAVLAPADMHFRSAEVNVMAISDAPAVAVAATGTTVASIDVVAVRELRPVTVIARQRALAKRV